MLKLPQQVLYDYLNSFGLIAYEQSAVPKEAIYPYMTYDFKLSDKFEQSAISFTLWYNDKSWANADIKSNEIFNKIGRGGVILQTNDGAMWVKRGTPFSAHIKDDNLKVVLHNLTLEFL